MSKPCVFFDRDGIVNAPPTRDRYVRNWEEFHLIPEFLDALRIVSERGYEAVIVTNQKGVATGRMSQRDVDRIHRKLRETISAHDLQVRDILVCTAADDADPRRKPNPGMLLDAVHHHDLDVSRSWMIGDNEKDVEAGRRAGCRTIFVGAAAGRTRADYVVADMKALPGFLANSLPPAEGV